MSEHMPTPWTFWADNKGAWMIQSGDNIICQRNEWNHRAAESLANGQLFFVAPDMLAILQRVAVHAHRLPPQLEADVAKVLAALTTSQRAEK